MRWTWSNAFFRWFLAALIAVVCAANAGATEDTKSPSSAPRPKPVGTAYCGLHCVYAAIQGKVPDAEFDRLLNPRFINGEFGSSDKNLIDAFAEYGVAARFSPSVSLDRLMSFSNPVILHVRPVGRRVYSHWILFLGFEGDHIRVFDPPRKEDKLSATDLLSVWDGGVVIPDFSSARGASSDFSEMIARVPASVSMFAMILICAAMLQIMRSRGTSLAFISACLAVGVFAHVVLKTGFAHGRSSIGGIQASYFPVSLPEIDITSVTPRSARKDVLLIDARPADAFERFHLPGAINIPVDSTLGQLSNEISKLQDAKEVIIYCQSEGCRWAHTVGNQIVNRGIKNVSIYRGGVNDWQNQSAP